MHSLAERPFEIYQYFISAVLKKYLFILEMENPEEIVKKTKTPQNKLDKVKARYDLKKTEITRNLNLNNILKLGRAPSRKTMEKYDISFETVCLILEEAIRNLKKSQAVLEENIQA